MGKSLWGLQVLAVVVVLHSGILFDTSLPVVCVSRELMGHCWNDRHCEVVQGTVVRGEASPRHFPGVSHASRVRFSHLVLGADAR